VTVGETLTAARSQAGLTVDELSERTRIRETVIRSIEQDDYDACGGDVYVRGYVRAIAGAVGIDAQPLIREYDQVHAGSATMFDLPPVTDDPDVTRFDLPPVTDDPTPTMFDLPPVTDAPDAGPSAGGTGDLVAAGYDLAPGGPPGPQSNERRNRRLLAAAAVVLLLILGTVLGLGFSSGGSPPATAGASPNPSSAASARAEASAQAQARAEAEAKAKARDLAKKRAAMRIVSLPVAAAKAFGPHGVADGDNGRVASWAIASNPPQPWMTQWYVTPLFGHDKLGTGLLLDLGRQVTVTSVQADLSRYHGVNLELRAGNGTAPRDLRTVAAKHDTGGVLRLTLSHPVTARYLVIWFTWLPPDGAGHYAETVGHVSVKGR
jgi:hypothetical protein